MSLFAGVDPIRVEEIQNIVWRLKYRNIGILITDHNVDETLAITDRAYLLFEGRILFRGSPEELAENKIVKRNTSLQDLCSERKISSYRMSRKEPKKASKMVKKTNFSFIY